MTSIQIIFIGVAVQILKKFGTPLFQLRHMLEILVNLQFQGFLTATSASSLSNFWFRSLVSLKLRYCQIPSYFEGSKQNQLSRPC